MPNEIGFIQENTLKPVNNPVIYAQTALLGSLNKKEDVKGFIRQKYPENLNYLFSDKDPKFTKICECESTFRSEVCSYAGCHSGMGVCGFIPSTWNLTVDRMKELLPEKCRIKITSVSTFNTDKTHPVFDPECNVKAAYWLYQTDGDGHWNSSKKCWGPATF